MNTENYNKSLNNKNLTLTSLADKAIYSKLQNTIKEAHEHIRNYRFDLLAQSLYEFTWHDYCDWYLEIAKTELNDKNTNDARKSEIEFNLLYVLNNILKLLHPIIPFITEEIWQNLKDKLDINDNSIMISSFPLFDENLVNKDSEEQYKILQEIISAIRNIRSEMNVANNKSIDLFVKSIIENNNLTFIKENTIFIENLCKINKLELIDNNQKIEKCSTKIIGEYELNIPLADLIDISQETLRVNKEIEKLEKDIEFLNQKLSNSSFVDKAPKELVEKHENKKQELLNNLEKLSLHLETIKNL